MLARLFALLLLPITGLAQYSGSEPVPADVKKGFDSISVQDAKKWLGYLAGPECLGRGTGQPGYQKAAEYMAARFKEFGLKPAGNDDSFFQYVPFRRYRYDPAQSQLSLVGGSFKSSPGKNFAIVAGTKDIDLTSSVAFIRAKGVPASSNMEGVKGKVAFLLIEDGFLGKKLVTDVFTHATYVFVVVDKVGEQAWKAMPSGDALTGGNRSRTGYVTLQTAKKLADELRIPREFWDRPLAANTSVEAGSERQIKLTAKVQTQPIGVPNVIGVLEGSDPKLKQEVVAVGAHLDHIGTDGHTTWWGADDNASGCTALLGAAKALAKNGKKPKRSVLFIAFGAEELALIGSKYFVDHPTVPFDTIQCYFNLDMVGRDSFGSQIQGKVDKVDENADTMRLVGSGEYGPLVRDLNRYVGFKFKDPDLSLTGGSDHTYFLHKGVPIAFLFCGLTPDYHKPSDTADKVNFIKVTNAAKLTYLSLIQVANTERRLK